MHCSIRSFCDLSWWAVFWCHCDAFNDVDPSNRIKAITGLSHLFRLLYAAGSNKAIRKRQLSQEAVGLHLPIHSKQLDSSRQVRAAWLEGSPTDPSFSSAVPGLFDIDLQSFRTASHVVPYETQNETSIKIRIFIIFVGPPLRIAWCTRTWSRIFFINKDSRFFHLTLSDDVTLVIKSSSSSSFGGFHQL